VGLAILRPLRELDQVAYLRFASVYRSFTSVADFEKEIAELKARQSQVAEPPGSVPTGTVAGT
jgi:transcriptional repressor NrdR